MRAKRQRPRAIDVFAGAGGLSQGLRRAGYDVIGAEEIDAHACATYRANHKGVRLWEQDVTRVTGPQILRELGLRKGELDLLAACPPCQGFSAMRTRNGAQANRDVRNDLIFDVLRLVRSLRPVAVMIENVPGLAADRRFKDFCDGLRSAGYTVKSEVLNTVDFGVPQRRRRLVLVASRVGEPKFAAKCRRIRTVREALAGLVPPFRSRDQIHRYTSQRNRKVEDLIANIPKNGGSRGDLGKTRQLECHKRLEGFHDVYGRMSWDEPAPTITGGCISPSKGRFLHPTADRAITLREAALLQTFPKRYRFVWGSGRYAVALLIGNALPPEFIRRHALALKRAIVKAAG